MSAQIKPVIEGSTSAVSAGQATKFRVKSGESVCVSATGLAGAEEVEIVEDFGGTYGSIADPDDTTDASKKVLKSTMTARAISGPFNGAISKTTSVGDVAVYLTR